MSTEQPTNKPLDHLFGYFERNQPWLNGIHGFIIVAIWNIMIGPMIPEVAATVPHWLSTVVLILASFLTGFGAMMTETASAAVVRYIAFGLGIALILYALLK